MSTFDLENSEPKPGDSLRDEAANLLSVRFGRPLKEERVAGKKVDIYFVERDKFGKNIRYYVEAKDYTSPLGRNRLVNIWSDYSGIIEMHKPANLLIITRSGLTTDGQAFVAEQADLRHQTIWELENDTLGLREYVRSLEEMFDRDGLREYYVAGRAREAQYALEDESRVTPGPDVNIISHLDSWILDTDYVPIAILGGYGAGKTSLAYRFVSSQARKALNDPFARIPVLVRLGTVSRYSSLDGILASTFASESRTANFSFPFFVKMNEKGRLVIVLDGFDEMKHAMSWSDFREQIRDLNQLIRGKAKLILLGRPTAFLSFDEQIHVLRGVKKWLDGYRRLPDWPEFREYDIQQFSNEERRDFISRYLSYCISRPSSQLKIDAHWVGNRVDEVNALADADAEVFAKPVHARILTDLACDPNVSLARFSGHVNQWVLYREFFSALIERELGKESRQPIGEEARMKFLRELGFWLWSAKDASTSFVAEDVPHELFLRVLKQEADPDQVSIRREFFTGAFLERKSGGVLFFAHRSFAEFLVADYMLNNPPQEGDHQIFSKLLDEGVVTFLDQSNQLGVISGWADTLSGATGFVNLGYVKFVAKAFDNDEVMLRQMGKNQYFKNLISNLFKDRDLVSGTKMNANLLNMLRDKDDESFHPALSLYSSFSSALSPISELQANLVLIAAAMLDRVFVEATEDVTAYKWWTPGSYLDATRLLISVISDINSNADGRTLIFSVPRLAERNAMFMREHGVEVRATMHRGLLESGAQVELRLREVTQRMRAENAQKVEKFARNANHFRGISGRDYTFQQGSRKRPITK